MAAGSREFFSHFRHFGSSLERDCNDLKSRLDDNENATEKEGRSHLVLRGILSDITELKGEMSTKATQAKANLSFGEFLTACERLAEHTKDCTEDLEEHLQQYGYRKPGDLPLVESIYEVISSSSDNDKSASMETEDSDSSLNNDNTDDNGDVAMETESKVHDEQFPLATKIKTKEDDPLKSPVKPDTFTPMIQLTPLKIAAQEENSSTPPNSPIPPQTTTPMINSRRAPQTTGHNGPSTPDYHTMPQQPLTFTPMIKSGETASNRCQLEPTKASASPLPIPPMLSTPGLKMMRPPGHVIGSQSLSPSPPQDIEAFSTPTPPEVTSVILLQPEDIKPLTLGAHDNPSTAASHNNLQVGNQQSTVRPISDNEHVTLPSYIKTHFSVEHLNKLLERISEHLADQCQVGGQPKLCEAELQNMFHLGGKTKAFMLVLTKLRRAKVSGDQVTFVI